MVSLLQITQCKWRNIVGSQLTLRPATPADALSIAEVVNAHALEVVGTRRALIDDTGKLRFARYVPHGAEQWVATTDDGAIVAFVYLGAEQRPVVYETGGAVHPHYRDHGMAHASWPGPSAACWRVR